METNLFTERASFAPKLKIITAPDLDRLQKLVNEFLTEAWGEDAITEVEPYGDIQHYGHELFAASFIVTSYGDE